MTFLTLSHESLISEMGVAPRLNATSTHKQDTHTLRCTLHGLQGIRQTPLTSTTAVRMLAEGAATAAAWPEARISAPDMTGIAIRQLMLLVHGTRTAQRGPLDRPQSSTACWIKDMMKSPHAILLTGSSQRIRPYVGRPETASLRRHRAKLQQIADCRLQISDDGSRLTGVPGQTKMRGSKLK
jgi:hypothetical protein